MKNITLLLAIMLAMLTTSTYAIEPGLNQAIASWMVKSTHDKLDHAMAQQYVKHAFDAAHKWTIDPFIVLAMMKAESNYKHNAKSSKGAQGLMQVIARYHREKIGTQNLYEPRVNIDVGARIVDEYLERNNESITAALKRYSGNARSVYKARILEAFRGLVEAELAWRLANDKPLVAEHSFKSPRRYNETFMEYQLQSRISDVAYLQ